VWAQAADARADALPSVILDFSLEENGLFPLDSGWGLDAYSFSDAGENYFASASYASVPSAALFTGADVGSETLFLTDAYVSASVLPGIDVDFALWNDPGNLRLSDRRSAALFVNSVISESGLRSPYVGLGASGSYYGASVGITDEIDLSFGRTRSILNGAVEAWTPGTSGVALQLSSTVPTIESTVVGLDWNVTDWADLGINAAQMRENGSVLGDALSGSAAAASSETFALGISARVGFGEGWVTTVAYNEGITQLDLNTSALAAIEPVRSQAYGISVAKRGVFGNDALGLSISRPLQTFGSTNFANLSVASVLNGRPVPGAPQSDFAVDYITTFLDGAVALQANAAYQINANGEQGQDAVSVLSRAKIKF
jgi:hypothetical protein